MFLDGLSVPRCGLLPVTAANKSLVRDSLLKIEKNLVVTITGRGPHPKYPYMRRMGLESLPMTARTLILGKYSQFMERLVLLVEVGLKCGEGLTCTCSNNFGGSMN